MRLVRYGPAGREKPGVLDRTGAVRDLSAQAGDIGPAVLSSEGLARLRALDPERLPRVERVERFGVPIAGSRKFIAIGLNFADHCAEANLPVPKEPVVSLKAIS